MALVSVFCQDLLPGSNFSVYQQLSESTNEGYQKNATTGITLFAKLIVMRQKWAKLCKALRWQGVTGIEAKSTQSVGDGCSGQFDSVHTIVYVFIL